MRYITQTKVLIPKRIATGNDVNESNYRSISVSRRERVAIIALDRPAVLNAIDVQMRRELHTAFETLRQDDGVGAVVLTGTGQRAFSAGMDLREFAALSSQNTVSEMRRFRWEQGEGIAQLDKPVIAAVNGLAVGGGVELALMCDIIFAADTASFSLAEVKRGLIPGNGGTQRLSRRVGKARALDMILTGRTVSASEALAIGLAEYVVAASELMEQAVRTAALVSSHSPLATRAAKASIHRGAELSLVNGLELERDIACLLYTSEDAREGPRAFIEKRAPVWRNR